MSNWYTSKTKNSKKIIESQLCDDNKVTSLSDEELFDPNNYISGNEVLDALDTIEDIWTDKCKDKQTEEADGYSCFMTAF